MVCFISLVCGGPHFLEETVGDIIIAQFISLLRVDEYDYWLQQDGIMCHMSNKTMTFLWKFFSNHLVSKDLWPPRSLDLSSPDFFLKGYLKEMVYRTNPHIHTGGT
jgi:hypothetical protein